MISIFELIKDFELSPVQLAKYLWHDLTFCGPDEECHYLSSLDPDYLEALGKHIILMSDRMRLEQAETTNEVEYTA